MNISITLRKQIFLDYGISDDDKVTIQEYLLDEAKNLLADLYDRYFSVMRTPDINNKILADIKKYFFSGMSINLMLRQPKGERFDLGCVLDKCIIRMGKSEIPLTEYMVHLSVIKNNKAFIQIK